MAYIYRESPLTTALWYALIFLCVIHILKELFLLHTFSLVNHCMCIHSNLSRILRVSKNTFFCAFVESLRQFWRAPVHIGSYEVLVNV